MTIRLNCLDCRETLILSGRLSNLTKLGYTFVEEFPTYWKCTHGSSKKECILPKLKMSITKDNEKFWMHSPNTMRGGMVYENVLNRNMI